MPSPADRPVTFPGPAAGAGGTVLCDGVSWPAADGLPTLALRTAQGGPGVVLAPGWRLGFAVQPGLWCLGHARVHGPRERTHEPCPDDAPAERGRQCGTCFARDDTRFMHLFHRTGQAPAGLRAYLAQPHWLYVAAFANGAVKVGTAADGAKWRRLALQGAVAARYVARTADGRAVRILEDLVTERLGIGQSVRSAAKAAGFATAGAGYDAGGPGRWAARLARNAAELVAGLLSAAAGSGAAGSAAAYELVDEAWEPPRTAAALLAAWERGPLGAYPSAFDGGEHGFVVEAVLGQTLGVRLEGSGALFAADGAALKGRRLVAGGFSTPAPAVQGALF